MMPDKDKKYTLLGLTVLHNDTNSSAPWDGYDGNGVCRLRALSYEELVYQIEQGNAVEVREPREFKTRCFRHESYTNVVALKDRLPEWFELGELTIREVLK